MNLIIIYFRRNIEPKGMTLLRANHMAYNNVGVIQIPAALHM
jgi:hypothetical protein